MQPLAEPVVHVKMMNMQIHLPEYVLLATLLVSLVTEDLPAIAYLVILTTLIINISFLNSA